MNRTSHRELADRVLAEVYALVPEIACKGLCHTTCTVQGMSDRERERIRLEGGIDYPDVRPGDFQDLLLETPVCPALTPEKRCAVYELRPLVCRVWGTAVGMRCPHGCKPARLLDPIEKLELLIRTWEAGGQDGARYTGIPSSEIRAFVERNPLIAAGLRESDRGGELGDIAHAFAGVLTRQPLISALFPRPGEKNGQR